MIRAIVADEHSRDPRHGQCGFRNVRTRPADHATRGEPCGTLPSPEVGPVASPPDVRPGVPSERTRPAYGRRTTGRPVDQCRLRRDLRHADRATAHARHRDRLGHVQLRQQQVSLDRQACTDPRSGPAASTGWTTYPDGCVQFAGAAGSVAPYEELNAVAVWSWGPGVDTCTPFWMSVPASFR